MGKRKVIDEGSLENTILLSSNDVLDMAVKMLGAERNSQIGSEATSI